MRGTLLTLVLLAGCLPDVPNGGGPGSGSNPLPDASTPVVPPDAAPDAPPPADPKQALKDWSGCMSLANFTTANMAATWGSMSAEGHACTNCHVDGGFGMIISGNQATFFKTITEQSPYMLQYFGVDAGKIVINTTSFNHAANLVPGHPHFDPVNNLGMVALKKFYDLTVARQTAATCDPSRLVN